MLNSPKCWHDYVNTLFHFDMNELFAENPDDESQGHFHIQEGD